MAVLKWLVLVGLALLTCGGTWQENGKDVPDTPWAKSDGGFGAQLVFTDRPAELFAAWEKPGRGVFVAGADKIVRAKPLVAVIFFVGCGKDAVGNCDTSVTFSMTGPDGKPYDEPHGGELWSGKPPPQDGQMQLSLGNLAVVIEPQDGLGTYTVVARIVDNVSRKTMVLERSFTAVESPK